MHNNDDDNVKHYNTKGSGNNNQDPHIFYDERKAHTLHL